MKINKSLLIAVLSVFAVSGVFARQKAKKDEVPGVSPQPAEFFYTGKPYDADLGSYTFNYRNYDPAVARWASADPSGFPDGANNQIYAVIPTSSVDPFGLYSYDDAKKDMATVCTVTAAWNLLGYVYAPRLAFASLEQTATGNRAAPSDEINALKTSSCFTNTFNSSYFNSLASAGSYNISGSSSLIDYGKITDIGNAYGRVAYTVAGTFSWSNGKWTTVATFTFDDKYDFNPNSSNPAIAAFNRLQTNGYASTFTSTGSFTMTFVE